MTEDIEFHEDLGYKISGDERTGVTLPHLPMKKHL